MQPGVIDLAEMKQRANERDAAAAKVAEERAYEDALRIAVKWDRAMRRAFKGILPRPEAHRFLARTQQDD